MPLIGYARVSTEDQLTARQLDDLRAAGCSEILEEHASGGDRSRPVLARLRPGDTLVVRRQSWSAGGRSGGPAQARCGARCRLPRAAHRRGGGVVAGGASAARRGPALGDGGALPERASRIRGAALDTGTAAAVGAALGRRGHD
ncbi:MAG: recombinase family protein [Rhodopila sp.]